MYTALDIYNDVTFEPTAPYLYAADSEGYFLGVIQYPQVLRDRIINIDKEGLSIEQLKRFEKVSGMVEKTDFDIANPILVRLKFKEAL